MSTLGEGIFAYLRDLPLIADGDRIYPQKLPQNVTFPAVTWQIIPGPDPIRTNDDAHSTMITVQSGTLRSRVQFSCWGETEAEAEEIGDQLYAAVEAFAHGFWGDVQIDAVTVLLWLSDADEKRGLYRRLYDVMIMYTLTAGS